MHRQISCLNQVPCKNINIYYREDDSFKLLTPRGITKISKFCYEIWELIDGVNTYSDIIGKVYDLYPTQSRELIEENAVKFFEYLTQVEIIDPNWIPFKEILNC